jgi:hypothetical protein
MCLSSPEGCETGLYLHRCRIKIIDNDVFPSNKYAKEILEDVASAGEGAREHSTPALGLMWEYIKFNLSNKIVRTASKKVFFSDVLDNVYYIWSLWLMKQLVAQAAVALTINSDSSNEEDDDESTADDTARRLLARMVRPVLRRLAFN